MLSSAWPVAERQISVQSSASQCGFILGIAIGSLLAGPSGAVNSDNPSRLIFSSASEKNRRAELAVDPTGKFHDSIIGRHVPINSGNRTKRVTALRRNFVVSHEHRSPVTLESRSVQCFPSLVTKREKYTKTSLCANCTSRMENKSLINRTTASLTSMLILRYSKLSKFLLSTLASVSMVINFSIADMIFSSNFMSGGTAPSQLVSSSLGIFFFLSRKTQSTLQLRLCFIISRRKGAHLIVAPRAALAAWERYLTTMGDNPDMFMSLDSSGLAPSDFFSPFFVCSSSKVTHW
mmetsp:Transcript_18573/g.39051  ORF Transcript_18573/g.39051 Transcript_18573/m.39051 type:complete len:292 (-) Transcript_18573:4328-5203(-)